MIYHQTQTFAALICHGVVCVAWRGVGFIQPERIVFLNEKENKIKREIFFKKTTPISQIFKKTKNKL
jgi:hypothetical protein